MSGIISKIYYNVECGKFTYLLWKTEQMFDKIITVNELEIFHLNEKLNSSCGLSQ